MDAGRRIIPISSGKGGVGKTTFAINFALGLSRFGSTVLIDLDTGTSSVRNTLDIDASRDLYHFFRRGYRLDECVTPFPEKLDPKRRFSDLGIIAGPRDMIEEITNLTDRRRTQLIEAINGLDARYVVLDLKAGFDNNVLGFLPMSNTGILVLTPHLPSANLAASQMAKAIIFRKLRIIFAPGSPFYQTLPSGQGPADHDVVNELIDKVEDSYDDSVPDLDAFVSILQQTLGDHPIVQRVADTIAYFRVWIVLNMFNGVKESYTQVIEPFVRNLAEHVSAAIRVTNLGWVVRDERIYEAMCKRLPAMTAEDVTKAHQWRLRRRRRRLDQKLADIERLALGLKPQPRKVQRVATSADKPRQIRHDLDSQLEMLRKMYTTQKGADFRQNFEYIVRRVHYVINTTRVSEFGDCRILQPEELLTMMFGTSDSPAPLEV